MIEINIDPNICKKDGLCTMACPLSILKQEEKGTIPKIDDTFLAKCFRCGQCVSIYPRTAEGRIRCQNSTRDRRSCVLVQ
jgi:ferredoxin